MMKILFSGTGTSTGIPEIGCTCEVCTSSDEKDKRLRTSLIIDYKGKTIVIDCGPDFRTQMLRANVQQIDALLITHEHYDHVGGLDDIRPFSRSKEIPIYAENIVCNVIKERMPYCFGKNTKPNVPNLYLKPIGEEPFYFAGIKITPIRIMHGSLPILGFRIANMAFLTDLTQIREEDYLKLENLDVLIIGALRKFSHPTHQTLSEAIRKIERIKPAKSYLIHASHHMGLHEAIQNELPDNIELSYDMLEIEI